MSSSLSPAIRRFTRLLKDPGHYVSLCLKIAEQPLAGLFAGTAFYMQGQMDINPRSRWHDREFAGKSGGYFCPEDPVKRVIVSLEPWDTVRRDMLILLLRTIVERDVGGDLAELGVYKGHSARLIHHYMPDRPLHLLDTFGGFSQGDLRETGTVDQQKNLAGMFKDTSVDGVLSYIDPVSENVRMYPGVFPASVPESLVSKRFAFVHLDADIYEPTVTGLRFFYPRMSQGGIIVVHDYNAWLGARTAVKEFFADKPEVPLPMPDKSGSVVIVKQ